MAGRALREVPVAERPRERLALRGPGGLTAAELERRSELGRLGRADAWKK